MAEEYKSKQVLDECDMAIAHSQMETCHRIAADSENSGVFGAALLKAAWNK